MAHNLSVEDRFWGKVDCSAGEAGCWLWMGSQSVHRTKRYGQFVLRHRMGEKRVLVLAHRMALALTGVDLDDRHVHHICEQTLCVNPAHLELVTPRDHLDRHGRIRWDRELLIEHLRRSAEELGSTPQVMRFHPGMARGHGRDDLVREWEERDRPHYTSFVEYFGSWKNAIEAAGLTPRGVGKPARI